MDLIASAQADHGLAGRGMEGALGIEFHVPFEFGSEIVTHDEAGNPSVRSMVDKLVTSFEIHVNRAEFSGEFHGQQEGLARRRDAAADGIIGVIDKSLRENRYVEARLSAVVKAPFHAEIGLAQSKFSRRWSREEGILDAQPGVFVSQLNAIAYAEIDVEVRNVRDRLVAIQKRHVAQIDFPIEMAGRSRIVGVKRRTSLSVSQSAKDKKKRTDGERASAAAGDRDKIQHRSRIVSQADFVGKGSTASAAPPC